MQAGQSSDVSTGRSLRSLHSFHDPMWFRTRG